MKEFYLSRVASQFRRGKAHITLFGYDEEGNPVRRVDSMEDFYYVDTKHADIVTTFDSQEFDLSERTYRTFDSKEAVKVISKSVFDKNRIKEMYGQYTYELDIPAEFKYVSTNHIKWSKTRRIAYFDIETFPIEDDDGTVEWGTPSDPISPITSIQAANSHDGKVYIFSWHPHHTKDVDGVDIKREDNIVYIFCQDEETMILSFFEWLKKAHIDVITGWYSNGFDTPYILRRCEALGIDQKLMSPVGGVKIYKKGDFWRVYINGLDNVDMMDAIQDLGYNLSNFKLATAAREILGEDEENQKLTEVTWRDWIDDYEGFLKYSIRDVEILIKIDQTLEIFDLYTTLQELADLPQLNYVLMKSTLVDFYILTEYNGSVVFPTRLTRQRKKYMGALVLEPTEPGLHLDVGVFDFASLYPTSVMAFNLSPDTFITSATEAKEAGKSEGQVVNRLQEREIPVVDTRHSTELFGRRYWFLSHKQKVGILPKLLKKLYLQRKKLKAEMKDPNVSDVHRNALDKHQQAIKLVLNSTYGAMGFPWFRLYKPEVADAITFFARRALQHAMIESRKAGMTTLYGDTDSIFVKQNGKRYEELEDWVEQFNVDIGKRFIEEYNQGLDPEYNLMELEFEKDMERFYMANSKKRYYGVVRNTGKKYIRGMNIIRKDAPPLLKDRLNVLAEKCVNDELVLDDLVSLRREIDNAPLLSLAITKAFGKRFDEYTKNMPQHLKGALFANRYLDAGVTHLDNPLMFYIDPVVECDLKKADRTQVICINDDKLEEVDKHPDLFLIDWDTFFQKQVLKQLDEFKLIPSVKAALDEYKELMKEEQHV